MRLHFPATLDIPYAKGLGLFKLGHLLPLRYDAVYESKIQTEIKKILEKNAKNKANGKEPIELDVTIDIHYAKRSVDQNSWLWAAHTLEANIVNGHKSAWTDDQKIKWREAGSVTPEMIHEDYMQLWAPRGYIEVEPGFVDAVRKMLEETMGKVRAETWLPEKQKMQFEVWKTSSYMNVAEFCQLAEKITENMLLYGIDISSGLDWNNLMTDLEDIKSRSVKIEGEDGKNSRSGAEEIPILTLRKDPVSIVKEVFKGKEV